MDELDNPPSCLPYPAANKPETGTHIRNRKRIFIFILYVFRVQLADNLYYTGYGKYISEIMEKKYKVHFVRKNSIIIKHFFLAVAIASVSKRRRSFEASIP